MAGGDGFIDTEQAAGVVPAFLDRGDAEVSARAAVHFQMSCGADAADVRLEANPLPFRGFAASGPDFTGLPGVHFSPRSGVKLDAEVDGEFLEAVVEEVAGQCESGFGKDVFAQEFVAGKPGDAAVEVGIGEGFDDAEGLQCFPGNAGDELAADAVARVAARLMERDSYAVFSEGYREGKSGEPASGDGDRFTQTRDSSTGSGGRYG